MKPVRLTRHAVVRMEQYGLTPSMIERATHRPDWVADDPQPGVERRFRTMRELGDRVLRVACVEEKDHIRVLSVFPDRDARRPDAP